MTSPLLSTHTQLIGNMENHLHENRRDLEDQKLIKILQKKMWLVVPVDKEANGPPKWFYKTGTHPPSDDAYFENMTRVIFQAGLSWGLIEKKWPNFQRAFENFSINKIARFGDVDVKRLMANEGIVRNRKKILATIHNAQQFQKIEKGLGSLQAYIDTLDKSDNYGLAIKEISKKFKHLGPSSARIFLYSVGEDIRHIPEG